jgi:hypothetical protein
MEQALTLGGAEQIGIYFNFDATTGGASAGVFSIAFGPSQGRVSTTTRVDGAYHLFAATCQAQTTITSIGTARL